jgi:hypothetical protein
MKYANILLLLLLSVTVVSCRLTGSAPADVQTPDVGQTAVPAAAGSASCFQWQTSLSFESAIPGDPMPTNGMNIAVHNGMLFAGFGTDNEAGNYSDLRSYVYRKETGDTPWVLDVTFEPGTGRVAALDEVRFERDGEGEPIVGGPVSLLVATTNKFGAGLMQPVLRVRYDENGSWSSVAFGQEVTSYNIRAFAMHRDQVTGADLLFIGAGPAPLGIFRASFDAPTGTLIIAPEPEFIDETGSRGKWFGFATANGALYGASRTGIYRRIDGFSPSWERVIDIPRLPTLPGGEVNLEYRGLVAVPSLGWPEPEMLYFYQQGRMWRARAGGDHAYVEELNLDERISQDIGYPVAMSEAAFNSLEAMRLVPYAEPFLFISIEFVFGDLNADHLVAPRDPLSAGDMSSSMAFSSIAYYLLRRHDGSYSPLGQMIDPLNADQITIIARDAATSPFAGDENSIYAVGFNASSCVPECPGSTYGKAWIYRGTTSSECK